MGSSSLVNSSVKFVVVEQALYFYSPQQWLAHLDLMTVHTLLGGFRFFLMHLLIEELRVLYIDLLDLECL